MYYFWIQQSRYTMFWLYPIPVLGHTQLQNYINIADQLFLIPVSSNLPSWHVMSLHLCKYYCWLSLKSWKTGSLDSTTWLSSRTFPELCLIPDIALLGKNCQESVLSRLYMITFVCPLININAVPIFNEVGVFIIIKKMSLELLRGYILLVPFWTSCIHIS